MAILTARRGPPAALAALLAGLALFAGTARGEPSREYQVKAAFLYNFVQFVEWPQEAFARPDEPLTIAVLGEDPFGGALEEVVRGQRLRGRPLVVRRARSTADLEGCQVVFVSRSETPRLPEVIGALQDRPVLSVSEIPGFAQRGGIINFYRQGSRVRFEINPAAARSDHLRLSSELLSVGTIVGPARRP